MRTRAGSEWQCHALRRQSPQPARTAQSQSNLAAVLLAPAREWAVGGPPAGRARLPLTLQIFIDFSQHPFTESGQRGASPID
jgi:hypothetical protein